jgi:hypothetical protein
MKNSKLENLPIKQLVYISRRLMQLDFDFENPYSNYEDDIDNLEKILRYFGLDAQQIDLDFIAKFISVNEKLISSIDINREIESSLEKFIIPRVSQFEIFYEFWGPAVYTEVYKTKWSTYDKNWVEVSIHVARNEGTWSDYDGDYVEHDTDNWEPDNFKILEKTKLLELRNLIDKKLKNL